MLVAKTLAHDGSQTEYPGDAEDAAVAQRVELIVVA
jgi:hypothetical protein